MVVDVRYMRERLKTLKEQIEEAQYRKFGCVVDMTELEQALLKRFIWDLRSSADEIRAEFHGLIRSIQVGCCAGCRWADRRTEGIESVTSSLLAGGRSGQAQRTEANGRAEHRATEPAGGAAGGEEPTDGRRGSEPEADGDGGLTDNTCNHRL